MKKNNLLLFVLLLLVNVGYGNAQKDGYVVEGKVYIPQRDIHLYEYNDNKVIIINSTKIVNGKFQFKGVADIPKNSFVSYGIPPSDIAMKLENHHYKLTSNLLDRENGKAVVVSKKQSKNYVIDGEVLIPDTIAYLCVDNGRKIDTLSSCKLKNGNFRFTGNVPSPVMAYIDYGISYATIDIMLENSKYEIFTDALDKDNTVCKTDGVEQNIFSLIKNNNVLFRDKKDSLSKSIIKARMSGDQAAIEIANRNHANAYKEQRACEDVIIKQYPNSLAALFSVNRWRNDAKSPEMIMRFGLLGKKYASTDIYKRLEQSISIYKNLTIGNQMPNFTLKNIKGEDVSLYDIKGKIKVLDFSASWCAPCRAITPYMLELYEKYNKLGLEIICISLDKKREDWVKQVEEEKLPWTQISDLKAWESPVAIYYNVGGIPYMALLDGDNRLIGFDVSLEQIIDILKQAFDDK